jgi:hypothetical protein
MSPLRAILRCWLLTDAERCLLADYARMARAFGEVQLDRAEAEEWGKVLATPTGRKIDAMMCDHVQRQAMRAIAMPGAELAHACGAAEGARHAWVLAKSLSTMGGTDAANHEDAPDTAAAHLDRMSP